MQPCLKSKLGLSALLAVSMLAFGSCGTYQPEGSYEGWTNGRGEQVELTKARTVRDKTRPAAELSGPSPYRLRSGDILSLRVAHITPIEEPELVVDDEGLLDLPLVGGVSARGMTLEDVRRDFSRRYGEMFTSAKVTVRLVKRHRPTCSVLGQVGTPGLLEIDEGTTLVKAIAQAGGFRYLDRRDALGASDLQRAFLSRASGLVQVDFEKLFLEGDLREDVMVQDGDLIFVPDRSHREVVVLGEVRQPGMVPMTRGSMNILQAVGSAGGFAEFADMSTIAVIRNVESDPVVRLVNTEEILGAKSAAISLQSGDVVFVARDDIRALDLPGMMKSAASGLLLAYGVASFQKD